MEVTDELRAVCQSIAERVQAYFGSEENQRKYEEWLKRRDMYEKT